MRYIQFTQGNNLPRVKKTNQSAIQRIIYYDGPITRSEIAQRLNLTMPTITTNINQMIASGIVHEVGSLETKSLGRRANLVDINPSSRYFLGVELRSTFRRLCITDLRGNMVFSYKDDTVLTDYWDSLHATCGSIQSALKTGPVSENSISAIGICLPGLIDSQNGVLKVQTHYSWMSKFICHDILSLISFNGPITVENNACARAFGAQLFQRNLLNCISSFAYMYINHGIACPLFINKLSSHGSIVGEGEVGHMIIAADKQNCEKSGCLEAFSSDSAIISRCIEALEHGNAPVLKSLCKKNPPSMPLILQAQQKEDPAVCAIIKEAICKLGVGIANIDNFVRPQCMLIEGKLFQADQNRTMLLEAIRRYLYIADFDSDRFIFVEPDEFSGAKGAAAVAIHRSMEVKKE